jgi:cell division protein FtsI/penicillin-binding protein 2
VSVLQPHNSEKQEYKRNNRRVVALAVFCALLWVITAGRLFFIQAIDGKDYLARADSQQQRKFEIPATRGTIYVHENDSLLPIALNTQVYTVAADPKFIKDVNATADALHTALSLPKDSIAQKLSGGGRYVELAKSINSDTADTIKAQSLPGIILSQRPARQYPEGELFSQELGYVNADGQGQYGFEQFADDRLAGKTGQLKTVTDSLGVPINSAENTLVAPQNGQSYVLTLDRGLQAVAADALKTAVETNRAESGSIIVMDPSSGAIKAMVNYPNFDPNNYAKVTDYTVFQNSAVSKQFEPGSGFKIITMAAGLDTGKVTPTTPYNDTGEASFSGYTIHNAENHKFGVQTMTDVIQKSLNTGVIFVLEQLGGSPTQINAAGRQVLYSYIQKFGFGKVTGIEQAGEIPGYVKDPTKAYDIDYANMTFGQGLSVNSIQMLAATAAIANGGKLYRPHIVEGTLSDNGNINKEGNYLVNDRVMSPEAAAALSQMMTQVVQHGSGYLTKMPGYSIAGKTGTAQVPRADGKGYEESKNIGSFVGFAPVGDPKFVMFVRVDYPHVDGFAEKTAVPAFAVVAKELLRYYHVAPVN